MNNISWFLYFTDIVQGMSILFGILSPIITIAGIILIISSLSSRMTKKYRTDAKYGYDYEEIVVHPYAFIRKWGVFVVIIGFLFALTAIATPSRNTMYMIAASQVGEQIIQLEEVQDIGGEAGSLAKEAISLLRQQIQEQLTEKPVQPD